MNIPDLTPPPPPKPPLKGGTAATVTVVGSASIVAWVVAKIAETHPSPWLATAADQAMVGLVANALISGPLGLAAAWWQHKKEQLYKDWLEV